MALIDRVKERTGTDLSDAELNAMIAAVTAELNSRFGPPGPIEVTVGDPGDEERWRTTLTVNRRIDTSETVTIVESDPGNSGAASADIVLDGTDYRILHGGRTIQRLTGGPHANRHWAPFVTVTYMPIGDQEARDELTIKLIQLDLTYRGGLTSERAGDYQFTLSGDPIADREKLLASFAPGSGLVMA